MAKIVIAEDEPDIRELIAFTLRFAGYEVITASNGEEGYEFTKKEHPDLAMFDVRMPKMTGYDACKKVKADPEIAGILVDIKSVSEIFETLKPSQETAVASLDKNIKSIGNNRSYNLSNDQLKSILEKVESLRNKLTL